MRLHRADVLSAALDLLDAEGLDGLSMRRLATRLDVQVSALYWHYRDKQALLDAMAEQLMEGVADIDPVRPGLAQLAELGRRPRSALLARRDGARVVSGTYVRRPNTLRFGDTAVRAALAAGIPAEEAGLAFFTLQDYVLGHTIEEQSRNELLSSRAEPPDQAPEVAEQYPAIRVAIEHWAATDADVRFHYGLDVLIDGLRARHRTQ